MDTFTLILITILVVVAQLVYKFFLKPVKVLPIKANEAIFVTGGDSGMGEQAVLQLSKMGYFVFAGCYLPASKEKYANDERICYVQIDVTKNESIKAAVETTRKVCAEKKLSLFGLCQAAGIAIMAPIEYFPEKMFRQQIEVNLFGYILVAQAFLPTIIEETTKYPERRGRIMWFGTGGGVPATSPPLISGYMTSKWGIEAFCQSMRVEMQLRNYPIDCLMINPGIIKPTGLEDATLVNLERTYQQMPPEAREKYGGYIDKFIKFNANEKGTHPSVVSKAVGDAFIAAAPPLRYKVGFESVISPFVGLLPTNMREFMLRKAMFEHDLP